LFLTITQPPPSSTLFPYTTLFRSRRKCNSESSTSRLLHPPNVVRSHPLKSQEGTTDKVVRSKSSLRTTTRTDTSSSAITSARTIGDGSRIFRRLHPGSTSHVLKCTSSIGTTTHRRDRKSDEKG